MANEAWAFGFIRNLYSWGMLSPDGIKCAGVNLTPITLIQTPGINKLTRGELLFTVHLIFAAEGRRLLLDGAADLPPAPVGRRQGQVGGEGVPCSWCLQDSPSAGGGRGPAGPRAG